jgi:hypothetical protein
MVLVLTLFCALFKKMLHSTSEYVTLTGNVRKMVMDLVFGFRNLYQAVFDRFWPFYASFSKKLSYSTSGCGLQTPWLKDMRSSYMAN